MSRSRLALATFLAALVVSVATSRSRPRLEATDRTDPVTLDESAPERSFAVAIDMGDVPPGYWGELSLYVDLGAVDPEPPLPVLDARLVASRDGEDVVIDERIGWTPQVFDEDHDPYAESRFTLFATVDEEGTDTFRLDLTYVSGPALSVQVGGMLSLEWMDWEDERDVGEFAIALEVRPVALDDDAEEE